MSMMFTGKRLRPGLSRLSKQGAAAVAASALMLAAAGTSQASTASEPYGEVTRFGGPVHEFASGALSAQDEGKFVMPVGFAVEPESATHETNNVYVLDRTLNDKATGELDYRLQKISSTTHEVLGSTTISEKYTDKTHYSDAHPLVGLAVDPARKRVYTIVESMIDMSGEYVPVAGKLVAWSTEPEALTKHLVRAPESEFPEEDQITKASVVANESTFKVSGSASEVLYAPSGLAVDPTTGDVAVEAQAGASPNLANQPQPGPTVVQLVRTTAPDSGTLGNRWTSGEAVSEEKGRGNGLFAGGQAEEFGVDLFTEKEQPPNLVSVGVGSGSTKAIAPTAVEDTDEAASLGFAPLAGVAPAGDEDSFDEVNGAGSPVIQLPGSNIYAAVYAQAETGGQKIDSQGRKLPWAFENEEEEVFKPYDIWIAGNDSGSTEGLGNIGVRLFEADGNIVDTIGGGTPNDKTATGSSVLGSCNIDFREASLAAGAEGAIFVLTQPRSEGSESSYEYDDEIIEFKPGGAHACPSVKEGSPEVKEGKAWKELQKGDEPEPSVTVAEGVPVKLSAQSLDQEHLDQTWTFTTYTFEWPEVYEWTPFAIEWNLEGTGYDVVHKIEAPEYLWPSPEVEHTYATPGVYHAAVRVYGDYGTKVIPFLVHVLGSSEPKAEFSCEESGHGAGTVFEANSVVTCDASASTPTPGTEIEYYEWSFGDGTPVVDESSATVQHTFTATGEHQIKLVIHDKAGSVLESKAAEEKVTVEPETTITTSTTSSSQTTSSNQTSSTQTSSSQTSSSQSTATTSTTTATTTATSTTKTSTTKSAAKPAPKPLTLKQKLAKALKSCKKDKSKKKRASCERAAQKKFAPKKKASKKKGKTLQHGKKA